MTSPARLHEAAIVLENDREFYRQYSAAGRQTFGRRRSIIGDHLWRHTQSLYWMRNITVEERDLLRRYFDEQYKLPQDEPNKYEHISMIEFWRDDVRHPPTPAEVEARLAASEARRVAREAVELVEASTIRGREEIEALYTEISTWEQPTMSTPIVITTVTLVNGTDIAKMPDSAVFELIASEETKIKELDKIEAKPKKLVAEIEKRRAGIAALVAHLDKTAEA